MNRGKNENIFVKVLRFIKYNKLFTLIIAVVSVLVFYIFFADKGYLTRLKFQREKAKLEKQLIEERKKQDTLRMVVDSLLNSNVKIEKVAREKYYMTKEGEVIYKVEYDSSESK